MTLDPKTLEHVARMFDEEAADADRLHAAFKARKNAARVRAMAPKVEDGPALIDLAAALGAPSSDDPVAHVMAYVGQPRRATREECLAAFTDQPRTAEQERADVVAWLGGLDDGTTLAHQYADCIERGDHVGAAKGGA